MSKKILLFIGVLFYFGSLSAQEAPEVQKSLISKIAATWCPPCGGWGWSFFHDLANDNSEKALLIAVHHSGDLVNATASDLTDNFNAVSQPRFYLGNADQNASAGNATTKRTEIKAVIDANYAATPVVNTGLIATYEDNVITVNTKSEFFQNASGEYYLGLYIVEDGVVNYQASIGPDAVHYNVLRTSMSPSSFGVVLSTGDVTAGTELTNEFSISVDAAWNLDNLTMAAIIWKKEGDTYEFVNTNSTNTLEDPAPVGVYNIASANWEMTVQPTISSGLVTVNVNMPEAADHFQLKVYNQVGQLMETLFDGQLEVGQHSFFVEHKLAKGLYFVNSSSGNKVGTKRLIVQ